MCINEALAQNYWFRHYWGNNGLSNNNVSCALQDDKGFLWFGTLDGLNRFDGYYFKVFRTDPKQLTSIGNNVITALYEDRSGTIWIGTHNGLWLYNAENEEFHLLQFTFTQWVGDITEDKSGNLWFTCNSKLYKFNIRTRKHTIFQQDKFNSVATDSSGNIFSTTNSGCLYSFHSETGSFKKYVIIKNNFLSNSELSCIAFTDNGQILIGTKFHGLKLFDKRTSKCNDIPLTAENDSKLFVTSILRSSATEYWIGTHSGIYIINLKTGKSSVIKNDENKPNSLSDDNITDLISDREGGIWATTKYYGIDYYNKKNSLFNQYQISNQQRGRNIIGQLIPDNNNLWVVNNNQELYTLNLKTGNFQSKYPEIKNITCVFLDNDQLWIGRNSGGISIIDVNSGKVLHNYPDISKNKNMVTSAVNSFCRYNDDIIIGSTTGVYIFNRNKKDFSLIKGIPTVVTSCLTVDHRGGIWVGTYFSGVFYIDPVTMVGRQIKLNFSGGGRFNNTVTSIFEDTRNNVWFASESVGIACYNTDNKHLRYFTADNGLPSNNTFKIVPDNDRAIWISTSNGLCRLNLSSLTIDVFNTSAGLPCDQFNYDSGTSLNGKIYFGSIKGVIGFVPALLKTSDFKAPLYVTGFQVESKEMPIGTHDLSLTRSIVNTRLITLPYDRSSISIDFAALSYHTPELTKYSYRLKGLENTWTYLKTNRKIYFTKLSPGKYIFEFRASSGNQGWTQDRKLEIVITPAWYASIWAYVFYSVALIFLIWVLLRFYNKRAEEKAGRYIIALNHEKNKEIYEAKIDFFTKIAHEIRTPLSLIVAPIEKIENTEDITEVRTNAALIQKNTERLIKLTNQLLDFRKIEHQNLALNFVSTNVSALLTDLFARFKPLAQASYLRFQLLREDKPVYSYVDPEALTKIISNLLQNAIKFAEKNVSVSLQYGDLNSFLIEVSNDGRIIPHSFKEKIFEPFFRLNSSENIEGTGIGLALARSLAEVHNGSLTLEEVKGTNRFTLNLPIHQEIEFDLDSFNKGELVDKNIDQNNEERPSILLVEDSVDILGFLYSELKQEYNVITAVNGIKALEQLSTANILLVVSDIMMPEMDGLELCRRIKSEITTSHIPVILLTAKTQLSTKIAGLELNADAYIEKPFSPSYLKAQIANLLRNRANMLNHFNTSPSAGMQSLAPSKTDDAFLQKLNGIILQNLDNGEFDVDELASMMFLSRRNLYRKIKAVADMSPMDMINLIRLKKGAELLLTTDLKIYEIAIRTGFNSPNTFSRNFVKQFGESPSDYVKRNTEK
ncbi:MAG: two-component regulator propeller domain-containing protein [Mucilaginibacter sp.]